MWRQSDVFMPHCILICIRPSLGLRVPLSILHGRVFQTWCSVYLKFVVFFKFSHPKENSRLIQSRLGDNLAPLYHPFLGNNLTEDLVKHFYTKLLNSWDLWRCFLKRLCSYGEHFEIESMQKCKRRLTVIKRDLHKMPRQRGYILKL